MAKNKVTDWDTTAANNTDISGTGILGSNAVSNFDDAIRNVMAQVAAVSAGTYPLKDTFSVADPADLTKIARFDCGSITTSTTRVMTVPDVNGTLYTTGNILGTVSQSGGTTSTATTFAAGTPTGEVIESGAGANGHYTKWADGTMICWVTAIGNKSSDSATGNIYNSSNNSTWTFPVAFVIAPAVSGTPDSAARWMGLSAATTTSVDYKHFTAGSTASAVSTSLMAIGRWR